LAASVALVRAARSTANTVSINEDSGDELDRRATGAPVGRSVTARTSFRRMVGLAADAAP
jgi:hypothetical protein